MISRLDTLLGRQSIYRVVTAVLLALAVVAVVLAAVGSLDGTVFPVDVMLLTLVVLVATSVAATSGLGLVLRVRPQRESALITALLLWFLYWPASDGTGLAWLALAALLANASKYLIAWRGRHLLNPAAAGVVALALVVWVAGRPASAPYTTWWVASEPLLPWVVAGGLVIVWRLRRILHSLVFVVVATALSVWALTDQGQTAGDALRFAFVSSPVVFLACLMLTEPLTLGPRRRHQVLAAVVAAVVFTLPITMLAAGYVLDVQIIGGTYEVALLAANLIAFACGQRGSRLEFLGRRPLGDETVELTFRPRRRLRFAPGQYIELDLGPSGAPSDRRGLRRMLSISSPPGGDLTVAVRVPERPSGFKQALLGLRPGQVVRASSVGGDFVRGRRPRPRLLVAGGIGVTPYLSQLRVAAHDPGGTVLVYGTTAREVPYATELAQTGVRVVVVSPEPPDDLPAGWQHVTGELIDADLLHALVPDLRRRQVFLSGPPAMVDALRVHLPRARTDHFAGY